MTRTFASVLLLCAALAAAASGNDQPFKGAATLSYRGTAGNTETHGGTADGGAEYSRGLWVIDGGGDYSVTASEGEKKAETAGLSAGAKFFFTGGDRLYARYKGRWRRNTFAGFESRLSNFGGLGVYLFREESKEFAAGALLGYIRERYVPEVDEPPAAFPATCVGLDCEMDIDDFYRVNASVTWDISLEDVADQLLAANLRFGVFVRDWLVVTVTEKAEWDTVTPAGYAQHDLATTVGLTFTND